MSISQRMANPHERPQQLDHAYRIGGAGRAGLVVGARRLAERAPLDESHGVKRRLGFAQLVDRHDSRMLELSGDPGFGQKPGTNFGIASLVGTELFERDLPPQRCVMSQPDLAHPSLGVKVRERVPLATITFPGTERFDQHVPCRRACRRTLSPDCRLYLRQFAERFQASSINGRRQCGFYIAAVRFQFFRQDAFQLGLLLDRQPTLINQPVSQWNRRLPIPGRARLTQPIGVDHSLLECNQAEKKLAVGVHDDLCGIEISLFHEI